MLDLYTYVVADGVLLDAGLMPFFDADWLKSLTDCCTTDNHERTTREPRDEWNKLQNRDSYVIGLTYKSAEAFNRLNLNL